MSPNGYLMALVLFLALATDYFDGYLARKHNAVSQLGEILDPIGKILILLFYLDLHKSFQLFNRLHWSNRYN